MTDNRRLLVTSLSAIGRRKRLVALTLGAVVILGIVAVMLAPTPQQQERRSRRGGGGGDAVPVLATPAKRADVPVYLQGVGTARALNTVTVRAQVDGKLLSVAFKEGQDVKKGDVLARIDPAVYQAQLDQAVAKKAQDEALLANAQTDLERYTRLAATNSITKQQADTQRTAVAQLQAQVNADQAVIDNARTILGYTTVVAPINGRTGIRQVDEGNIVRASDSTGIVVLTEIRPISVIFNLPQQVVGQVNTAFSKGPLPVDALASDGETVIDHGTLQVVDNQVDPTTGTVKLKAEFPNANLQLWSGQFVNVRMLIDTRQQVVVVPTAAVQRGPSGAFLFIVKPDGGTVAVRSVTVAQQDDLQAVIATGVESDEQVVTTGFSQLSDGQRVAVTASDGTAPRPQQTRPGNRRQNRPAANPAGAAPGTAANPPAGEARPNRQQRSSTGAAASPAP